MGAAMREQMNPFVRYPALLLATLGALSGQVGTYALGLGIGNAPHPGLYMVLTGLWFGLVVGFGIWRYADRSLIAVAIVVATTWFAWEVAVNLAMQITENWLKTAGLSVTLVTYIGGFAAGAVGAFLTWGGAAAVAPMLRPLTIAGIVTSTGALFGLLLTWTSQFDHPAVLLVPWQSAVAGALGLGLAAGPAVSGNSGQWLPRRT